MAKIFPIIKKTVVQNIIIGGGGDEIQNERQTYDLPEIVQPQTSLEQIATSVPNESYPTPIEEVVAALLARAEETVPLVEDMNTLEVTITPEQFLGAEDTIQIPLRANEFFLYDSDTEMYQLELTTFEVSLAPVETIRTTVGINDVEFELGDLTDMQQIETSVFENRPEVEEMHQVELTTFEISPTPIEDVNIDVTVTASEMLPEIVDDTAITIIEQSNFVNFNPEDAVVVVNLEMYANVVQSNTGWTNPNNTLGNTSNTAATLTATSSGLLGTTNNTTNGTIVLDFQDQVLGDFSQANLTSAIVRVELQRANAGVAIVQPTSNIQFQYSLNNGDTYTTFYTLTAVVGKQIQQIDITGLLTNPDTQIDQFRIRATGSITSGTGVGAASTASFFRAWLTASFNKTY